MSIKSSIDYCPTCKRRKRRTNEANRRYWLLLHLLAEKLIPLQAKGYSADTWHIYYKTRYLGADEYMLPNGKQYLVPRSTADLDTDTFSDYMTKVEAHANEHGVFLDELPD